MKQIEINTEKWKGHVILHDPIPLVMLANFEEAFTEAIKIDPKLGKAKAHVKLIPSLIECVKEWHIEGFDTPTVDTFPGAGSGVSKVEIINLVTFITDKILKLIQGKDPNA